eukprot:INCI1221.1.p1 GENE.INCI1221.1~~INCI1221.1.p1  ORF type:complete len:222 (+),score=34.33 INCI1221.1:1113-1778(+)
MDPSSKLFYVPETPHERRGRQLQEAGALHGVYSRKSFEAAVRYARPGPSSPHDGVGAAAAVPATGVATSTATLPAAAPAAPAAAPVPVQDLSVPSTTSTAAATTTPTTPTTAALAGVLDLPSLDLGVMDFLGGTSLDMEGLSPFPGASGAFPTSSDDVQPTGLTQRDRSVSFGDLGDFIDELEALPLDGLDVDPVRSPAVTDALMEKAWEAQRPQLTQSWW